MRNLAGGKYYTFCEGKGEKHNWEMLDKPRKKEYQ